MMMWAARAPFSDVAKNRHEVAGWMENAALRTLGQSSSPSPFSKEAPSRSVTINPSQKVDADQLPFERVMK